MALALMKNYDPFKSPTHFKLTDLMKKFDKTFGATKKAERRLRQGRRRPHRCGHRSSGAATAGTSCSSRACGSRICSTTTSAAPSAASFRMRRRKGRSRFCAYNTGIGWRNIIEKMHMTATLTKWYDEHGRHEIFAGGKKVELLDDRAQPGARRRSGRGRQAERPRRQGIAKNAREEKLRARKSRSRRAAENERMAALYRQHVLKEAGAGAGHQDRGPRRQEEASGPGRGAQGDAVEPATRARPTRGPAWS